MTGATGYIGSRLVKGLLATGWHVHIVKRPNSSLKLLDPCLSRLTVHTHDDASTAGLMDIVEAAQPDVVYHLAAMTGSEHHWKDVDPMVRSNVLFSSQLLEAMLHSGARYFVNTETFWEYAHESEVCSATCLYAATKSAFRKILAYYAGTGRIDVISLILYDTYGPCDPRKKLLYFLKQTAREGRVIDMTPGEQIIDLTHVDDVVAAYIRAGELLLSQTGGNFETYAVMSGRRIPLKQLVELIIRETGLTIRPKWGGKPYRRNEVMVPYTGRPLPGWQPKIDLAAGIREIFDEIG